MSKLFTVGDFIKYEFWNQAVELIEFQISQKKHNKYYNTFQIKYYESIDKEYRDYIKSKDFFNKVIKNSLFYGLRNDFFSYDYPKPKSYFRMRNYKFVSYCLMAIHNMFGIYLLDLTSGLVENIEKSNNNIKAFYGGNLVLQENKLVLDSNRIYHYPHYKKFTSLLRKHNKKNDNRSILRIDIENYYDSASIKILLENIKKYVKPIKVLDSQFDYSTIRTIDYFYKFISSGKGGIPIVDNGITSSFIGYLYLLFVDIDIIDEIKEKYLDYLDNYKIIRYIDDIFIVLDFKDSVDKIKRNNIILQILADISEILYYKYDLKINEKTKVFDLALDDDIKKFNHETKQSSFDEKIETEEDKTLSPQDKLEAICLELEKMKNEENGTKLYIDSIKSIDNIDLEKFKDIYEKNVINVIKMTSNQEKLEEIFENFNYKLMKLSPKPMIVIIEMIENKKYIELFVNYILDKQNLTATDLNLIIEYLCQIDFKDNKLFEKLRNDKYFSKLMMEFDNMIKIDNSKYFGLCLKKLDFLIDNTEFISQIIRREYAEKQKNYNLALNHLVNEFQLLAFLLEKPKKKYKDYLAPDVINFIKNTQNITTKEVMKAENIFDRRNINQISHGVNDGKLNVEIEESEFYEYKETISIILKKIVKD